MKRLEIEPQGWPCKLKECPPGHFMFQDSLCFKSEYMPDNRLEVFCDTGECFWGGTNTDKDREELCVQPVVAVWKEE